ncbi:MAG TPA: ABC transporter permease [Candidatus Saccharimonadales bacterium]
MKFVDLLQTARGGMKRSRARTFLTITAIFIGAMTITLTNGIGTGAKSYLTRQSSDLGAKNVMQITPNASAATSGSNSEEPAAYNPKLKTSSSGMTLMSDKDLTTIKATPDITGAAPAYVFAPDYIMGKGGKYQLTNVGEQPGDYTGTLVAGKNVDNSSNQSQIVLSDNYVSDMGYGNAQALVGEQVTIAITDASGQQQTIAATVVGVQPKFLINNDDATANLTLAKQLYDTQSVGLPQASKDQYSMIFATFPSSLTNAQITNLKNSLKSAGYSAETLQDAENTVFTAINAVIIVLDTFGAITLLAASFGIINTLYMSVQERTKEIGLMKALGMSRSKIFTLFSIEALLMGFWGSALGVLFASIIGKLVNTVAKNGFLKDIPGLTLLTFPLSTIIAVILGIMSLAFLAGTLPALRASRKNPIEALRYE